MPDHGLGGQGDPCTLTLKAIFLKRPSTVTWDVLPLVGALRGWTATPGPRGAPKLGLATAVSDGAQLVERDEYPCEWAIHRLVGPFTKASKTESMLRSRETHCLSCWVSPTSTTKRFLTIGCLVAQRLEDVDPGLGEGPREVLEQAGAVPGVDLELDPVGGLVVAVPADVDEPLRRLLQGATLLAVLAVDRDPAAERDVADDLVAGHRAAALGEPDRDVVDALDLDPEVGRLLGAARGVVAPLIRPSPRLVLGDRLARLSRCITLLATTFAEILPWPRAM